MFFSSKSVNLKDLVVLEYRGYTYFVELVQTVTLMSLQKPILLQGHERSITQIKYNREGDLLFSVAKDTVSRAPNQDFSTYKCHLGLNLVSLVNPCRWPMFGTLSMVRGLELIMVTQELFGVSTVTVSFNK